MKETYLLGIDFGSLSARAAICRAADGKVMAEADSAYAHGVMSEALPCGKKLPPDWALQHPQDYLDALAQSVTAALEKSGLPGSQIAGIGIDFTGSTPMPLAKDGRPLCFLPEFVHEPHAYVKLWKHHAAAREAEQLNELCRRHAPQLLETFGGRINAECFFAKLLQVLHEAPAVFEAADRFLEAGDWITQCLTGTDARSASMAANKAFYQPGGGYPAFLREAHPAFDGIARSKLRGKLCGIGQVAGHLTPQMAARLHLPAGIPVCAPQFDAHAAVPALGIDGEGAAMLCVGTSSALILAHPDFRPVQGTTGVIYEGTLPGLYGYASGQASMGDLLAWFVENCTPAETAAKAHAQNISVHALLSEEAARLRPGQSGLLALDWWNGNRSVLADSELSGLMLGMTLQTRPAEIYRALMESLAFGLRRILESHAAAGIYVHTLHLAGGISYKNPLFMQIISDATGMTLRGSLPVSTPAVGMAIFAAVAAGIYPGIPEAIRHMNCLSDACYRPNAENSRVYDALYHEYLLLHDYFGRGGNDVMKRLRALRRTQGERI